MKPLMNIMHMIILITTLSIVSCRDKQVNVSQNSVQPPSISTPTNSATRELNASEIEITALSSNPIDTNIKSGAKIYNYNVKNKSSLAGRVKLIVSGSNNLYMDVTSSCGNNAYKTLQASESCSVNVQVNTDTLSAGIYPFLISALDAQNGNILAQQQFLSFVDLSNSGSVGGTPGTITCKANYHLEKRTCLVNVKSCANLPDYALTGTQAWNGSGYDACQITSCQGGYDNHSNACIGAFAPHITGIAIAGNQVKLQGTGLSSVTTVKLKKENGAIIDLGSLANGANQLTAEISEAISLGINEAFQIIIGDAYAQSVPVDAVFTVTDNSISNIKIIDHTITTSKMSGPLGGQSVGIGQSLKWNGSEWVAESPATSAQMFVTSYDASTGLPDLSLTSPQSGDYYIVSKEGSINLNGTGAITYKVGDQIIYDGSSWKRIASSSLITSVFGRIGEIVAQAGDYSWGMLKKVSGKLEGSSINDIADVDLSIAPQNDQQLTWSNGKWIAKAVAVPPSFDISSIADNSIASSKVSGLSTSLAGKEPLITAGTSVQYWRGDKTWKALDSLAVLENTNLYFTAPRAVTALLGASLGGVTLPNAPGTTISGLPTPVLDGDASNKKYVDDIFNPLQTSVNLKADKYNLSQNLGAASLTGLLSPSNGSDAANKTYVDTKEPLISAGTSSQYWRGDKTWQTLSLSAFSDLNTSVLAIPQGQASAVSNSNTKIVATDTISGAFLALQKQINYMQSATNAPQWSKTVPRTTGSLYQMGAPNSNAVVAIGADTSQYFMQSGTAGMMIVTDQNLASNSPNLYIDAYDDLTTVIPELKFRKAHGSLLSGASQARTAVGANETVGAVSGNAYNGVTYPSVANARIEFVTSEAQTSSNRGMTLDFSIIPNASFSAYKMMRLAGQSTNSNITTVQIAGRSGTGASPSYSLPANDSKASLDVNGSVLTRTHIYASGSAFDMSFSNSIAVTAPTGSSFALSNIQDGGAYTIAFQDSASTITPAFTVAGAEPSAPALTLKVSPTLAARTSGKHVIYTLTRMGTFVYMNWQEF